MPTLPDLVRIRSAWKSDRRIIPRTEKVIAGTIVYGREHRRMHCFLLNLSDGGAMLLPTDIANCPDRFSLEVADQPVRHCKVVWREQIHVGVKFA